MSKHKVGDIVTCNRGGWWKVVAVDVVNKGRLILELVLDHKGNVPKNKKRLSTMDTWCNLVLVNKIKEQRDQDLRRYNNLLFIIDPSSNAIDNSLIDEQLRMNISSEPDYLTSLDPPASLNKK